MSNQERILLGPYLKFQFSGRAEDFQSIKQGSLLRPGSGNQHIYRASVLVVSSSEPAPSFTISPGVASQGYSLDKYKEYHFYRYDIEIEQTNQEQSVTYTVAGKSYTFLIPGIEDSWRWAFYSCNGFSNDVTPEAQKETYGGDKVLWEDLFKRHRTDPFHLMVGGGDQLYCDDIFVDSPLVDAWKKLDTREKRLEAKVDQEMRGEIEHFYFNNYVRFFGEGLFAEAMGVIPYTFGIDDHDIFDGYGSYPKALRECEVIQAIGAVAYRFYLLFQQHTTSDLLKKDGFFGEIPQSYVTTAGTSTAFLVPDARCERTEERILSSSTYDQIEKNLRLLPNTIRHLIVVLGVPIIYPRLEFAEKVLGTLRTDSDSGVTGYVTSLLRTTGVFGQVVNYFDQPELLDDLADHWTSAAHSAERKAFIQKLQNWSRETSARVTFIAGDVHACSSGYLKGVEEKLEKEDYRYMVQITSSGIVNAPPPNAVIEMLHRNPDTFEFDANTKEEMFSLFGKDVDGQELSNQKVLNRRNWCSVVSDKAGGLEFAINVERVDHDGSASYTVNVPPLLLK